MSKLTYIRCGDYDIPNLKLSEQPETSIGKYGRMRKSYLKGAQEPQVPAGNWGRALNIFSDFEQLV